MKANVGGFDRVLRIAAGVALIAMAALGFIGAWGYIGVALALTGIIRWCPAYLPLGFSSCKTKGP